MYNFINCSLIGGPKVIERSLAAIFFDPNEPLEWRCNQILSTCLAVSCTIFKLSGSQNNFFIIFREWKQQDYPLAGLYTI